MVKEVYAIDEKNGNNLWQDAIQKETEYVKIAFQTIPKVKNPPNGFQYADCHMVFDIKMEDFQRKACLVTGCHTAHALDTITYSSVVTRENMCIALIMAM